MMRDMYQTIEELRQLLSHYQALQGFTLAATEEAIKELKQGAKQAKTAEIRKILADRTVELSKHYNIVKSDEY